MKYIGTKDGSKIFSQADCVLRGFDRECGILVPQTLPSLTNEFIDELCKSDFVERTSLIVRLFFDETDLSELTESLRKQFDESYYDETNTVMLDEGVNVIECSPISANSIFSSLLSITSARNHIDKRVILSNIDEVNDLYSAKDDEFSIAFWRENGINESVVRSILSETNASTVAVPVSDDGIEDCLTELDDGRLSDALKEKGYFLRVKRKTEWIVVLAQTVNLISSYCDLLNSGRVSTKDCVNVGVCADNINMIIACIVAKRMGLPLGSIIVGDTENRSFVTLLSHGKIDFDKKKGSRLFEYNYTSSSFETLIYYLTDCNDKQTALYLDRAVGDKKLFIDKAYLESKDFLKAGYATDDEIKEIISFCNDEWDYLCAPQTATAISVFDDYSEETDDENETLIVSKDNPFDYAVIVNQAITDKLEKNDYKALKSLCSVTATEFPDRYGKIEDCRIPPIRVRDVSLYVSERIEKYKY